MSVFQEAELTIYDENGDNITIGLTPVQILVILKALGITIPDNISNETAYQAFNDQGLKDVVLPLLNKNPCIKDIKPVVSVVVDTEDF